MAGFFGGLEGAMASDWQSFAHGMIETGARVSEECAHSVAVEVGTWEDDGSRDMECYDCGASIDRSLCDHSDVSEDHGGQWYCDHCGEWQA